MPAHQIFSATCCNHRHLCDKRNRCLGRLLTLFALSVQCSSEEPSQGDTHERIRTVRPIVHVLFELPALSGRTATASHQTYWIHFQQDSSRAGFSCSR